MLVLSAKEGETIVVPEIDLTIRIGKQRGKRTSLGFEAPQTVKIYRGEVYKEIQASGLRNADHDQKGAVAGKADQARGQQV